MMKRYKIGFSTLVSLLILSFFLSLNASTSESPISPKLIFDLHSDTIGRIYQTRKISNFNTRRYEASLPFLLEGGITAQFVAMGGGESGHEFEYVNGEIEFFYKIMEEYSEYVAFAGSA